MLRRTSRIRGAHFAVFGCLLAGYAGRAQSVPSRWVTTWATAQTAPYGTENLPAGALGGTTLRQVVHLSAGGPEMRLKPSNVFGNQPLSVQSVHIALPAHDLAAGATDPSTDRVLMFGGKPAIAVPAGAEYLSDPFRFSVAPVSDLVVSMAIQSAPANLTLHAGAHATSFLLCGDHAAEAQLQGPQTTTRWNFLSGVEVAGSVRNQGAIIAYGDSITDGHGSTTDHDDRWPDVLARCLDANASGPQLGVINEGIGGHQALVAELETALQQLCTLAHAHGIRILGATLTPFVGSDYYHPNPATEADRQALNAWIRTGGAFDGVIDFDAVLRDPAHPDRLLPVADSGDHLHPGPAGYRRMAEAVPLPLLLQ